MTNNNTIIKEGSPLESHEFSNPETFVTESYTYVPKNTVKVLSTRFPVPTRGTNGAAAYDIQANLAHEINVVVEPGETQVVGTGLTLELPNNLMALLLPRSGLATKHGVTLANAVGLIDPDYRGEIKVAIRNEGKVPFVIKDGDRIAQMLIMGFVSPEFVSVREVFNTARGAGGFGSTGV